MLRVRAAGAVPTGAVPAGLLAALTLAACGPSPVRTSAGPISVPTSVPTSAGRTTPGGAAGTPAVSFSFTLPASAGYRQEPDQVTENGATVRRWLLPLGVAGTGCVVLAAEQSDYRGSFPAVQLAAFGAARGPGSEVVRNEPMPPPDGAVAAIEQELRFVLRRSDRGTAPARLFARQYLTPGRTLISLNAAGPDDAAGRCRPEAVVASLLPTGREYTAPGGPAPSTGSVTGGTP